MHTYIYIYIYIFIYVYIHIYIQVISEWKSGSILNTNINSQKNTVYKDSSSNKNSNYSHDENVISSTDLKMIKQKYTPQKHGFQNINSPQKRGFQKFSPSQKHGSQETSAWDVIEALDAQRYVYIYIYVCVCVGVYICIYIYMHMCMVVYMYVYEYMHMYRHV
jgi:hypothetical protein